MTGDAPFERLTPEGSGADVGLLIAPARAAGVDETCAELLTTSAADRTNVLFVTTRPADRALARYRAHRHVEPNEIAIVSLGRASSPGSSVDDPLVTHQATVGNPANLTKVGIEATDVLEAWVGEDVDVTVCVDSATALLQYTDERTVFRFLAELIDLFRRTDAWAHVHIDPDAHDRSTVSSFYQLFDVVIDRTEPREERQEQDAVEEPSGDRTF